MTTAKTRTPSKQQTERDEAIKELRAMLKPGDTVNTVLRHCSASGMSRVIDLVIVYRRVDDEYPLKPDGSRDYNAKPKKKRGPAEVRSIGWWAARAMGDTFDRDRHGIKISGAGMDMGFALVYNLGRTLFPRGFKVKGRGRNGDTSGHDNDGGYALNHRWL
jgi:hypothetical protein